MKVNRKGEHRITMEQLYAFRENIIRVYKSLESFLIPILKFMLGYFIFAAISKIGFSMEVFSVLSKPSLSLPYKLLMSLFFAILPINISHLLITLNIAIQFSANLEIAVIISSILLLTIFFYGRLGGREQIFIILTIIGFYFKFPYIIPLIAGLYYGVQSVVPISIGVFYWKFYPLALGLMEVERPKAASIMEIPENFAQVLTLFLESVKGDNSWIITAFVFALVTLVVYCASKMDVDYSKEIAVALGVTVNIISFIFLKLALRFDVSLLGVFFVSVLCGIIMVIVIFFDIALNYQQVERVEFEDDDNYYYVKVIPKIIVNKKERSVKNIKTPIVSEKRRGSLRGEKSKANNLRDDLLRGDTLGENTPKGNNRRGNTLRGSAKLDKVQRDYSSPKTDERYTEQEYLDDDYYSDEYLYDDYYDDDYDSKNYDDRSNSPKR